MASQNVFDCIHKLHSTMVLVVMPLLSIRSIIETSFSVCCIPVASSITGRLYQDVSISAEDWMTIIVNCVELVFAVACGISRIRCGQKEAAPVIVVVGRVTRTGPILESLHRVGGVVGVVRFLDVSGAGKKLALVAKRDFGGLHESAALVVERTPDYRATDIQVVRHGGGMTRSDRREARLRCLTCIVLVE